MSETSETPINSANHPKDDEQKKAGTEPSGSKGDNPATAGPGNVDVHSNTPENRLGHLNPSAPEDANTTPQTTGEK